MSSISALPRAIVRVEMSETRFFINACFRHSWSGKLDLALTLERCRYMCLAGGRTYLSITLVDSSPIHVCYQVLYGASSNSRQEGYLAILLDRRRSLHQIIANRQSQPLASRRRIEPPLPRHNTRPVHAPCSFDRLPQRKKHRAPQEQWRLADALATLHTPEMVPAQVISVVVVP